MFEFAESLVAHALVLIDVISSLDKRLDRVVNLSLKAF